MSVDSSNANEIKEHAWPRSSRCSETSCESSSVCHVIVCVERAIYFTLPSIILSPTNFLFFFYDGAALAATRSPVIALFWCLIKFTTTTTTIYW